MHNPEELATYGTQDQEKKIKNGQSRGTGNIWDTRPRKSILKYPERFLESI